VADHEIQRQIIGMALLKDREMRNSIWLFFTKSIPEGQLLPKWAVAIRFCLYPLDTFYWHLAEKKGRDGYRWQDDTWLIHGIRYSSQSLLALSKDDGALLRVVARDGETVRIKRLSIRK
jgi:hypothetical protein